MSIDLRINYPVLGHQAALLQDALRLTTLESLDAALVLPPFSGRTHDREIGARWLSRPEHPPVSPSRVFLGSGGHHSFIVCLLAAGLTGTAIAVEPVTYSGFLAVADLFNLQMTACDMDEHGLIPEALRAASRKNPSLRSVYLMPTVHNPLGTVMPTWRREEIITVARERDLLIIEDDAYGFLEPAPPPSFALLAPQHTFYFLSLSKPFSPGLKTAFLAVPERLVASTESAIRQTVSGASSLLAGLACRLIADGSLSRVILAKRADAIQRQKLAREILDGLAVRGHPSSYHLWLTLGSELIADEVCASLQLDGIETTPARLFVVDKTPSPNAFRVALGQERDMGRLAGALREVARRCKHVAG